MFEKDKPFIGEPRSKGTPSSRGGVKECAKAPTQEDLQRGYRLDGGKTLKEDQRTEEQELAEFFKFVETMKDPANLWRYERFGNYMLSSSMIRAAKRQLGDHQVDTLIADALTHAKKLSVSETHTAIEERSTARLTDSENKMTKWQDKMRSVGEVVKTAVDTLLCTSVMVALPNQPISSSDRSIQTLDFEQADLVSIIKQEHQHSTSTNQESSVPVYG